MLNRSICILFLICVIPGGNIFSQVNNFENFGIHEGLQSQNILCVLQDSRGIIWLGTHGNGLIRFEGDAFHTHTVQEGLLDNTVRDIVEDKFGNLWIATDAGLNIHNGYFLEKVTGISYLENTPILDLLLDKSENIWLATRNNGIIKLTVEQSLIADSIQFTTEEGLSSDFVFKLEEDIQGRIWAGTFGKGINIISPDENDYIIESLLPGIQLPSSRITALESDKNGNIWVGTYQEDFFYIDIHTKQTTLIKIPYPISDKKGIIWNILCDSDGIVWLCTDSKGVIRIDSSSVTTYDHTIGLPGDNVYCMLEDFEKNLWFSIYGMGLSRFRGEHFSHFSERNGIGNKQVSALLTNRDNSLLISTVDGYIYKLSQTNLLPSITPLHHTASSPSQINDIAFGNDSVLWIATSGEGIVQQNNNSSLTTVDGLANDYVNCLFYELDNNRLWCGTRGGLSIFNGQGFYNITEISDPPFINNEIQHIIQDNSGAIWVATLEGLVRFKEGLMTTFDEEEGLNYLKINTLASDNKNNIWIGTFGDGLYVLRNNADTLPISKFADTELLGSNNIYSILNWNDTTLYVATDKGIDKLVFDTDYKIVSIKNYEESDGFSGKRNQINASLKDASGSLWFGTSEGITRYDPNKEMMCNTPPKIHLSSIELFYMEPDWTTYADSLSPWFQIPVQLELPYIDNHLTFRFSGISNTNREKTRFTFYLEGQDKSFTPKTENNYITYSGLKPKKYTLHAMAVNSNDVISEEFTFSFIIRPPIWGRAWFYILITVLVITGIFIIVKNREKRLIARTKELERIVDERTEKIKDQKDTIEKKNQDITASIQYAKSIQDALLPSKEILEDNFKDYFILEKPLGIVSGDFFWVNKYGDKVFIAAVDCTGHGVPGAFMSMLGITFLNDIVNKSKVFATGKILNMLRENIITSLKQDSNKESMKDGMDIALYCVDLTERSLTYSGAYNPLWMIRNNSLSEFKADRMPIGIYTNMDDFNECSIDLQKDDALYIFSDGFVDQFGGPVRKKFKAKAFKELLLTIQSESFDNQKSILDKIHLDWKGNNDQVDDILVIGVRI